MSERRVEIDLLSIHLLTGILLVVVLTDSLPWLRVVLGIPFVFLFPGYTLVGALFPKRDSLSYANRLALSLGLSIVIVVLTGLMLNYSLWGIRSYSIIISISILISLLSVITWYIRGRYYSSERDSIRFKLPRWHLIAALRSSNRVYLGLLTLAIITSIGILGYVITKPMEKQPFTKFYILGVEKKADNYPLEVKLGEEKSVIVGIVNHEHGETDYRLEVSLGKNKLYDMSPIILAAEEAWHCEIRFAPEQAIEKQKMEFRLTKASDKSGETRYIWLNVKT